MPFDLDPSPLSRSRPVRCGHVRQRDPLRIDVLLVCAWPGCPEGTRNAAIQVSVGDGLGRAPVLARFERETLPRVGARLAFRWRSSVDERLPPWR